MPKQVALTIKPHWAYAIFHLGKDIENRSWSLPGKYEGQRVWIHSGKTTTNREASEFYGFAKKIHVCPNVLAAANFPCGEIVGSVEFSSEITCESKWMIEGFQYWKISNAVLLPTPIPAKGKLGFWDCTELIKNWPVCPNKNPLPEMTGDCSLRANFIVA